jgi:hypothetical protein
MVSKEKPFTPLDSGRYQLKITALKIEPAKSGAPTDVWKFTCEVVSGPDQQDGSQAKGKRFYFNINIMREEHPDYDRWGQIGVDEMKSATLCFGVAAKGNSFDADTFIGLEGTVDVALKMEKDEASGEQRKRNNISAYVPA